MSENLDLSDCFGESSLTEGGPLQTPEDMPCQDSATVERECQKETTSAVKPSDQMPEDVLCQDSATIERECQKESNSAIQSLDVGGEATDFHSDSDGSIDFLAR